MFQTFKRWLGAAPPPPVNPDPFGRERHTKDLAATERREPPLVVQREEIIDDKTRIAGYRFSTRWSDSIEPAQLRAVHEALTAENVAAFAERRVAFIPMRAHNWFRADFAALAGRHTVFVLDRPPEQAEMLERWHEVCRSIRACGARVALSGIEIGRDNDPVIANADILVLQFGAYSLDQFEMAMARIRRNYPDLPTAVVDLSSWPERRLCAARGAAYCLGLFTTCADAEDQPGTINQGRVVLIDMLNLLRRDADLAEIAEVAKRHPEIALKIVAMANSPVQGLSKPVASIDQALMILGRRELYRWLSIGMYRAGADAPRDAVLLELALVRGRFLELLGRERFSKLECEELFLVGLLSLLDSMLGVPMAMVLDRLRLSPAMNDVLLRSEGPLGRYLLLAIAVEKGRAEAIARISEQLSLGEAEVAAASTEAFAWADEVLQAGI